LRASVSIRTRPRRRSTRRSTFCAYIGPQYDFTPTAAGYICPKCRRGIVSADPACEIVGTSARCTQCGKEMIVSPPAASP